MRAENLKNKMQKTIVDAISIVDKQILINSLITNIENKRKQLNIQTLNTLQIILFRNEITKRESDHERNVSKKNNRQNFKYEISYKSSTRVSLISH